MQSFNGNSLRNITLSLVILSSLFVGIQPASAKQFKKLLETGQVVVGNDKPIAKISNSTIGRDGQIAVNLEMVGMTIPPGSQTSFLGIYSITKGGKISLVDQGDFGTSYRSGSFFNGFTAPSISGGEIFYGTYTYTIPFPNTSPSTVESILKGGTVGNIKTFDTIIGRVGTLLPVPPEVSLVNGTAYVVSKQAVSRSGGVDFIYSLRSLDSRATMPSFLTISSGTEVLSVRTSSQSIVVRTFIRPNIYKLLERPNIGQFVQLNPLGQNPGSCGFAVSLDNIISCSVTGDQYILSTRFGKQANFVALPLPNPTALKSVSDPSISGDNIIFKTTEQTSTGAIVDKIYTSLNRQAPKVVIAAGEQLDGKTVTGLKLSDNGRTIALNSAVFTATFSDGSSALYRVDL